MATIRISVATNATVENQLEAIELLQKQMVKVTLCIYNSLEYKSLLNLYQHKILEEHSEKKPRRS